MKKTLLFISFAFLFVIGCGQEVEIEAEKVEVENVLEKWREGTENLDAESIKEIYLPRAS